MMRADINKEPALNVSKASFQQYVFKVRCVTKHRFLASAYRLALVRA